MAKLTSLITFSGTLDGITRYTVEGRKERFLRLKGGASRQKILRDPYFENTRRTLSEFGGRGPATHRVLEAVKPLQTGQGTTGRINKLLTVIQKWMPTAGGESEPWPCPWPRGCSAGWTCRST